MGTTCDGNLHFLSVGRRMPSGKDWVEPRRFRVIRRHSFSYVVPVAQPGAGSTLPIVQLNEETIHVARDATGETPPQVWHRCQAPVS